jgi:hypothetical protein
MTLETKRKRVCDIIGEPSSWPNHLHGASQGPNDFRGARISEVTVVGNEVAVYTSGGAGGITYSIFTIEDKQLREGVVRVLQYGLSVYVAAYEPI